jgi:hypothetical protein
MSKKARWRNPQSFRLNVEMGENLMAEVESLRRSIQDGLPAPRHVSLSEVVRLAIVNLALTHLRAIHAAHPLNRAELRRYSKAVGLLHTNPACPTWLSAWYLANCPGALIEGTPGTTTSRTTSTTATEPGEEG